MSRRLLALLALSGLLFAPANGHAEEDAPATRVRIEDRGPNRLLLATGIATLAFSYTVSGYVGATSSRESERWLLVPVIGPFAAYAQREDCGAPPAISCDTDPTYRALIITSGALQLGGVAQIAAAFVKRELRERERPLVMPVAFRGGGGVAATGWF